MINSTMYRLIVLLLTIFTLSLFADYKHPLELTPVHSFSKSNELILELDLPVKPISIGRYQPYASIIVVGSPENINVDIEQTEVQRVPLEFDFTNDPAFRTFDPRMLIESSELDYKENYRIESLGDFQGIPLSKITFLPIKLKGNEAEMSARYQYRINAEEFDSIKFIESLKGKRVVFFKAKSHALDVTPWKEDLEKSGYSVEVIELEAKRFDVTRAEIKAHFKKSPFDRAFIFGDEKQFVTDKVKTSTSGFTPSDLKYFCFGEGDDWIPEVIYFRVPAAKYHKKYQDFAAKSNFNLALASNEGYNPSDIDYAEGYIKNLGLGKVISQNDSDSNPKSVLEVIHSGIDAMVAIGHGSGTAYASLKTGYFSVSDVLKMKQTNPFWYLDVTCLNGQFIPGKYGYEMFNHEFGATGYMGGSVSISWHPPAVMMTHMTKYLAEGFEIGEAYWLAQFTLLKSWKNTEEVRDNFEWYHIFGDGTDVLTL